MSSSTLQSSTKKDNRIFRSLPRQFDKLKWSFLTQTTFFETLAKKAFCVCDSDNTGALNKDELYAGILLVHLQLAKYAGAAACYPPSREVVDFLFQALDSDNSGYINEQEFANILKICSVDIASRIAVYYSILILLAPYLADAVVRGILRMDDFFGLNATKTQLTIFRWMELVLSWNQVAEGVVVLFISFLIVPIFFGLIDQRSTEKALRFASVESGEGDKKKDD